MSSTVSFRALGILISPLPSISVLSFADYVATAARLWPSQGERERESKKLLLVYIVNWVSGALYGGVWWTEDGGCVRNLCLRRRSTVADYDIKIQFPNWHVLLVSFSALPPPLGQRLRLCFTGIYLCITLFVLVLLWKRRIKFKFLFSQLCSRLLCCFGNALFEGALTTLG